MRIEYKHITHKEVNVGNLTQFYQKVTNYLVSSTQRKINGGISPANAPLTTAVKRGSKTLRDSGALLASISGTASSDQAKVGTNHIGAKINHFGGTIRAKKTWLFIPASAKTRTLQRRYSTKIGSLIKMMRNDGYSVWFQVKGAKGVVLAKEKGKKGNPFVLFVLKKEVTIPARPFLTIDEIDRKVILRYVRNEIGVGE